jgi:hypothetical protein
MLRAESGYRIESVEAKPHFPDQNPSERPRNPIFVPARLRAGEDSNKVPNSQLSCFRVTFSRVPHS